ncbi:MAG: hypothetical protein ACK559_02840, partial [bacterium]
LRGGRRGHRGGDRRGGGRRPAHGPVGGRAHGARGGAGRGRAGLALVARHPRGELPLLLLPIRPLPVELLLDLLFPVQDHPACVAVQQHLVPTAAEEGALILLEVEVGRAALHT